jgi:2-amino-4-hydroxy-6-hydroxymethyldihydropteridine diphosphokinase
LALDLDQAVVIALGSNLRGTFGSCEALLEEALARFPEAGLKIVKRSGWWRSAAWPDPNGPEYRNGVAIVEANAGPRGVLVSLLTVEESLGRTRHERNAPRTLDLDLIAHGRLVIDEPGLTLPHPRAHLRRFVMGPLAEIAPDWRHPVLGATAADLLRSATVGGDAAPA